MTKLAMPFLCGPKNSRYLYTGSPCPHLDLALPSNARTLGEAVRDYEKHFSVRVTPMLMPFSGGADNSSKYFEFSDLISGIQQLVDIHVIRKDNEICPKQDLLFPLLEDDIVEFGELIC